MSQADYEDLSRFVAKHTDTISKAPSAIDSDPKALSNQRTLANRLRNAIASLTDQRLIEAEANRLVSEVGGWDHLAEGIGPELQAVIERKISSLRLTA